MFIGVFVFLIQSRIKYPSEAIAYLPIYLSVHPLIYLPKLEVGDTKGMKITKGIHIRVKWIKSADKDFSA